MLNQSRAKSNVITTHNYDELDFYFDKIKEAARLSHSWIAAQSNDPLDFLRDVKFEKERPSPDYS